MTDNRDITEVSDEQVAESKEIAIPALNKVNDETRPYLFWLLELAVDTPVKPATLKSAQRVDFMAVLNLPLKFSQILRTD